MIRHFERYPGRLTFRHPSLEGFRTPRAALGGSGRHPLPNEMRRHKIAEPDFMQAFFEALRIAFRRMEDAGAFSVEAEVICDRVMAEISRRTALITSSLGSGSGADIIYLFQNDVCGEQPEAPRHARVFGSLHVLYEQIRKERRSALSAFAEAARGGQYPAEAETADLDDEAFEAFLERLE